MGYPMGFYLTRQPDGTWLGSVPGLGDPEVQRQVELRRQQARRAAALRPSAWVRLMDILRSGLERSRPR